MKKLLIICLAAALFFTLKATNPGMEDFTLYYAGGGWMSQPGFMADLPEGLSGITHHFEEGDVHQDYMIFSVYNFGGRLFLGAAGDFHPMT